jgi:transposase
MYVDTSKRKAHSKTYTRHLLRESYREAGKVKHRTIANISHCTPEEIEAIRLALRHKQELGEIIKSGAGRQQKQGPSMGAVWAVYEVARELGIAQALGNSRQGKLALWQVIARVIDQGSRLSAVRLAGSHAACDVLGITESFNEDDLYGNLDWLCRKQEAIERRLFGKSEGGKKEELFLYDVTSSYLEGSKNELAAFGYNRDGKRGKRQIVVGMLCNVAGEPLSIEVFTGNTQDPQTFSSQIHKVVKRFGGKAVTFVGDRGMIKSRQIEELGEKGFHYITALTKPEVETLLQQETLQLELFDQDLVEVETIVGTRYVLRRNPQRAWELAETRKDKLAVVRKKVTEQNKYLAQHPRAKVPVAWRKVNERAAQLKISRWVKITSESTSRRITLQVDQAELAAVAKLDGCYVLKTDLSPQVASKTVVHDRYKDLALVEQAFRISKTVELELRPINVRLATRTRGHAFVVMLAYRIVRKLAEYWRQFDITIQEGINELATLCTIITEIKGQAVYQQIPEPRTSVKQLLVAANIRLPEVLPSKGVIVSTKRKLSERRKAR